MLRNQKGFTLVELVIVIVIIGILAAIAIPKFADLSDSSKAAACKQNQAAIESAGTIGYANLAIDPDQVAAYPTIEAMVDPAMALLSEIPVCPSTGTGYTYGSGANGSGICSCTDGPATHTR